MRASPTGQRQPLIQPKMHLRKKDTAEVLCPEADLEEAEAGTAQRKEMEEGIETDPTKPKQKKLNIIHTHMEATILLQKQQLQK